MAPLAPTLRILLPSGVLPAALIAVVLNLLVPDSGVVVAD